MFFFISVSLVAQTTIVTGKVYNTGTNEVMPFVNVVVKGGTTGTTTDLDGTFTLTIDGKVDSIMAVYVGFKNSVVAVKQGQSQVVNIPMTPNSIERDEVVILPGENPAVTILKQVWAHESTNDKEKLESYQYEVYNKLEFDLNNISPEFQKSKVMKPVKFIFDNIDTTNPSEKPHLPLFFSESVSDFYYRKNPRSTKEVIKGSKVSGLEDKSVAQFTGDMYQNVNIYDNDILVFGKSFVSPISHAGQASYRYYLVDSMTIDGHWCHQIQFKPKRKQELTFYGNMWITDTSFAVKRIEMNIADDANINYVNSFYVIQEFTDIDSCWLMSKERVIGDFVMADKRMGFYGRKTTDYNQFVVNKPQEKDFYAGNLVVEQGAESRNDSFWVAMRHDSLNKAEQGIYDMVDSVQSLNIYKTWQDVVLTAYTGYKILGPWEYGPWYKTLSFNPIEGPRIRVGGRTSNALSRWWEASGYLAYGVKDQKFKYNIAFKSFITKDPRQLIGASYKNDLEILGLSNNQFTSDNIAATLFRRTPFTNFTHVEQYELWYERDWFTGLTTRLSVVNRSMLPLDSFYVHPVGANAWEEIPMITTSEVRLNVRFAYHDKYVSSVFSRVSVGTKWPVIQVNYVEGFRGVWKSNYQYRRVSINIDDRLRFGIVGYTNYIIEAGKTWGVVPFPLLIMHPGNETYVMDWSAFNMMNYFEFASDQYAQITILHHFDGFFLNHIPLMRKLKWREILTYKCLFGSVTDKNWNELVVPTTLYKLDRGPYMEVGAGLENIFKFFRVDVFWRTSYLDNITSTGQKVKPVGVRFSLQVIF
ncbi:MAG TPA: DUF5686 family protein [Bacteroidia bacterium]|nr:DUF5686 family protein [Bacteroidia bacterium]